MTDENNEDAKKFHAAMAPLMEAIGHVAHHWARLEYEINQSIWALAAIEPSDGACITSQIVSIVPRLRALSALAHSNGASDKLLKDLNRFSVAADKLARRRARAIHDPWFFRTSSSKKATRVEYGRLEVTADKRLTYEIKPQSREDVMAIAHDIIDAHKDFRALRERLHGELREQLELRLGKSIEDFLDSPNLDIAKQQRPRPPRSSPA